MSVGHSSFPKILVAEDEPLVRDVAVRTLRNAGYATLAAADGEEAVQLFQEHAAEVALVLLDVVMPKCTGRQTYERIKQIKPAVPVVFCTGYDPHSQQAQFIDRESHQLLRKPYDPETLLDTVQKAIDEMEC